MPTLCSHRSGRLPRRHSLSTTLCSHIRVGTWPAAPVAYMNQTLVTPFPIIMSLELLEWSVDFGKTTDTQEGCSSLHWVLRGANPETAGLNIGPKPLPPSMVCV